MTRSDAAAAPATGGAWWVYMILCSDGSLYTGITTDMDRRFSQHVARRGARYFRGRRPQQIVYLQAAASRSAASSREAAIKRLTRRAKWRLIDSSLNQLPDSERQNADG